MRALILAVFAELPGSGRDHGGARAGSGSRHDLALGSTLCTLLNHRLRRELRCPNRSWRVDETYIKVSGNLDILVPCRGFCWRNHRFHAVPETGFDGGPAVPALGIVRTAEFDHE